MGIGLANLAIGLGTMEHLNKRNLLSFQCRRESSLMVSPSSQHQHISALSNQHSYVSYGPTWSYMCAGLVSPQCVEVSLQRSLSVSLGRDRRPPTTTHPINKALRRDVVTLGGLGEFAKDGFC